MKSSIPSRAKAKRLPFIAHSGLVQTLGTAAQLGITS